MKFKPTPLLIVSLGLIGYGLYILIFVTPGKVGWEALYAMVIGGAGIVGLIIYLILGVVLRAKVWTQVGIETVFIVGLLYFGYKKSGYFEFHLPHNYRGYIVLVYGVDKAPKLKTHFYSNKIKFNVTSLGIIATSGLPNGYYSDPPVFLDSTLGEIDELPNPYKRHVFPYPTDTLKCGDKNYLINIWLIKDESIWTIREDTINHLDLKLIETCTLTKR